MINQALVVTELNLEGQKAQNLAVAGESEECKLIFTSQVSTVKELKMNVKVN